MATTKTKTKKATKPAAKRKATPKKAATEKKQTVRETAVKEPEARVTDPKNPSRFINDTRGPTAPVLGHFVDVVSGPHKGRYGTFETIEGNEAVVRTRDAESERLNVKVSDLQRAEAGRR
jgi:hypothetical protein